MNQKEIVIGMPRYYLLPFIMLLEGFVSIAVEILTIRQLLPVAGGSVVVTSLIIGVFLLFLALGYHRGGTVHQESASILQRNFMIASALIGLGLSYVFVESYFVLLQRITGAHVIYPLITYLLFILAPIVYLLGQTLPITMNIVRQDRKAGVIAGKALGLNTVGSFFGAIFTTVVLMHYLGVAATVFIVSLLLIFLSILLMDMTNTAIVAAKSIFFLILIFVVYLVNIQVENKFFLLTDTHANYRVLQNHEKRIFVINNTSSSMINEKNDNGFEYIEKIKKILFDDLQLKQADILVLGAGGLTLSRGDSGNNRFTYVDIDSQLKKALIPAFINVIKDDLVIDDARHFLNASNKKFAAIVVDAYSNLKSIPAHLVTKEFMLAVKDRLQDHGVAIFNVIANPMQTDAYSRRIDNTIRSSFDVCSASPIAFRDQVTNIVYACTNRVSSDSRVYTDNLNTSTVDSFEW